MPLHQILVKNISLGQIQAILMDLANMYKTTPFVNGMELYAEEGQEESYLILFPEQPDLERFAVFVNYIVYPINQKGLSSIVVGFFYTKHSTNQTPHLAGERVMVYVSETDLAYDNVFIATEKNETYLFDFGGWTAKLVENEKPFESLTVDTSNYSHYIDIHPGPEPQQSVSGSKPWWKFW